ncbi:Rv3235 family protein [Specibacter sp. RAF43]|uniref:Rv3235 family protein n=1 Tax=Specibacter sp. RAF43 TaxID=3233057 RepID=UPI003F957262
MSTMAFSGPVAVEATPATPLVRRPAPGFRPEPALEAGGTVVKMPQRRGVPETAPAAARPTPGPAALHELDPRKGERALVMEMSRRIALAALEVLSGARSVQQLARWLDERCFSALTTRARLHAEACNRAERRLSHADAAGNVHTLHRQPVVHSIHGSAVAPGVYETSLVVADSARFRAIAMRLEETHGTWKVTALQIG